MPQEPYYEVMAYWEAKAKRTEVTAALVTNVGQAAGGIVTSLLAAAAGASLDSLKPNIADYLGRNIVLAKALLSEDLSGLPSTIEGELSNNYIFMIDALKAGIGQGVGAIHSGLYGMLAGTDALLGGYQGLIQQVGINPIISRWVNSEVTPNIPDEETAWFMHQTGNIDDTTYYQLLKENGWHSDWTIPLDRAWTRQPPIPVLLDMQRRGYITNDLLKGLLRWYRFSPDSVENVSKLTTQYPEPYRLAEMHTKGLATNDEYLGITRTFGLPDEWAMRWSEGQLRYPDFNTALALLRRGNITPETFYFYMLRGQVSPEETEVMLNLKDVIPPIQDLIRFAVREAYGDHSSDVQYPAMVTQAKKMGLTEEASAWYWYAHWDRIPINLMFANYHRALWDTAKLERMLKIVDIHPDDRQDIINVAYGPPSIRELGYGWDVGVYTAADIERYRRFGGLSPEDALKSTIAIVAYRTEGERNSVRTEQMYAYGLEKIDEATLRKNLEDLNTPAEAIELWITRAKLYHERIKKPTMDVEGRIVSSSEALTAFKLGLRDEAWARAKLKDLAWAQDRIDVAIEKAKVDIADEAKKATEIKYRKLTVVQIRNFYALHLINKEQMTVELINLGYTPDDAEVLTEVYTTTPEVAPQPKAFSTAVASNMYKLMMFDEEDLLNNFVEEGYSNEQSAMLTTYTLLVQELPDLTAMYQKGVISGEDVVTELKRIEVPEYNARLLVKKITDEFQIERLTQEKNLTKAEILKGAKNKILTSTQASSLLQDLGYDANEALYILAINNVVTAGDPEGYWDMRRVTENFKKARGEKYMDIPDALITFEKQIKTLKAQITELKTHGGAEDKIGELTVELNRLEQAMKQLIIQSKLT
jgi:hypothetical protein